jgi:hypothetical protein
MAALVVVSFRALSACNGDAAGDGTTTDAAAADAAAADASSSSSTPPTSLEHFAGVGTDPPWPTTDAGAPPACDYAPGDAGGGCTVECDPVADCQPSCAPVDPSSCTVLCTVDTCAWSCPPPACTCAQPTAPTCRQTCTQCETRCNPPRCGLKCHSGCASASCPSCDPVCEPPVCHTTCGATACQRALTIAAPPSCEIKCADDVQCGWALTAIDADGSAGDAGSPGDAAALACSAPGRIVVLAGTERASCDEPSRRFSVACTTRRPIVPSAPVTTFGEECFTQCAPPPSPSSADIPSCHAACDAPVCTTTCDPPPCAADAGVTSCSAPTGCTTTCAPVKCHADGCHTGP